MNARRVFKLSLGTVLASTFAIGALHVSRHGLGPWHRPDQGVRSGVVMDPWGSPIQYATEVDEEGVSRVRTWSFGPDKKPDTRDDIFGKLRRSTQWVTVPDGEAVP